MTDRPDDDVARSGDARRVARAVAGDEEAFEAIVREHSATIYRVAAGLVGPGEAEDIVQEVFLQALGGIARFEGRSSLATWLRGVAVRVALKHRRWMARRGTPGGLDADRVAGPADPPDRAPVEREERAALARALDRLPDEQRAVVVLRAFEGLPFAEVAAILGIPKPTAESRMARAREALRRHLGAAFAPTESDR